MIRQQNTLMVSFKYELYENIGTSGKNCSHNSSIDKYNQCYFQPDGRYYLPGLLASILAILWY